MLESLGPLQYGLVVLILITAYTFRGVTGFGSGLIAIPLLVLILPISIVVPMIILLDYTASVSHSIKHREATQWNTIFPLLPFTLAGVLFALFIFKTVDTNLLVKTLGVMVLLFALYNLISLTPHRQGGKLWAVPAGLFGGLVGTLFGTGGPFYVIYLQLRHLDKTAFRATIASIFMIDGGIRIGGFVLSGFFIQETLLLAALGLPIMFLAMYLGGHIHTNISQTTFHRAIGVLLLGSGAALLLK
ncbi:MAG: sulfite exporter TauE/SafE family protein [Halobacteria archaeon]|nr:sulfite exporter TauE/SafE family protein [Halobacteria archaeon]